jgi:hypothetical protein
MANLGSDRPQGMVAPHGKKGDLPKPAAGPAKGTANPHPTTHQIKSKRPDSK